MEENQKTKKVPMIFQLFAAFFNIGILTFGGGLTMLPLLKYEIVEKRKWTSEDELLDCYAIGQCTPGIIAVNTATYVGYKKAGIKGGIFATLGMIAPSVIIITIVAAYLRQFMDNAYLQHALVGVRGVVCALMINTVITLAKKSLIHPICVGICVLSFALAFFTPIPTILIVVLSAVLGIVLSQFAVKKEAEKQGGEKS